MAMVFRSGWLWGGGVRYRRSQETRWACLPLDDVRISGGQREKEKERDRYRCWDGGRRLLLLLLRRQTPGGNHIRSYERGHEELRVDVVFGSLVFTSGLDRLSSS